MPRAMLPVPMMVTFIALPSVSSNGVFYAWTGAVPTGSIGAPRGSKGETNGTVPTQGDHRGRGRALSALRRAGATRRERLRHVRGGPEAAPFSLCRPAGRARRQALATPASPFSSPARRAAAWLPGALAPRRGRNGQRHRVARAHCERPAVVRQLERLARGERVVGVHWSTSTVGRRPRSRAGRRAGSGAALAGGRSAAGPRDCAVRPGRRRRRSRLRPAGRCSARCGPGPGGQGRSGLLF